MQTHFESFEAHNPHPASVVPNIPHDTKAQLGTVDKLAQSVVPRIVDKLNDANWRIDRLEDLNAWQTLAIKDLYKIINETVLPVLQELRDKLETKKPVRSRKKKEPVQEVDISEIADFDPDNETWVPMTIDGHQITGALIDVVTHLNGAASQMFSDELIQFVNDMEPQVRQAIAAKFPN